MKCSRLAYLYRKFKELIILQVKIVLKRTPPYPQLLFPDQKFFGIFISPIKVIFILHALLFFPPYSLQYIFLCCDMTSLLVENFAILWHFISSCAQVVACVSAHDVFFLWVHYVFGGILISRFFNLVVCFYQMIPKYFDFSFHAVFISYLSSGC